MIRTVLAATAATLFAITLAFAQDTSGDKHPDPANPQDKPAGQQKPTEPNAEDKNASQPARPPGKPKIAVIPKGTTHVFWKSVLMGVNRAADEFGAEVIWKGPLKENDRAQQIQLVQQFISQGVDAIALAPLDYKALVAPVAAATGKKIPVVIFDSALDARPGTDFVSFVATDNAEGGRLGGDTLIKLVNGKGFVALLRYQVGSASTDERERGFITAVRATREIQILTDNRYAGATAGEAKTAALNMMDDLRKADGVFCPNESTTLGMLLALRQEGLAGKIKFVGFDASPPLVDALKRGEINALIVQNPRKMGYETVKTLVRHLHGEKVEPVIDTGVAVVTKENLDKPEIRALIE